MNLDPAKLIDQLKNLWKQLGVNQRVSIVLALGVTLAGLASLAFWSTRADYSLLFGGMDEAESGKAIAALDDAKVSYRLKGNSIYVPADKVPFMRIQLATKGIGRAGGRNPGFELIDKANFGISDFLQRANYMRALQGELERTISYIDGVQSASVFVTKPENRLLTDRNEHATASVLLRLQGNTPLPPQAVNAIRFLVANSVEGLKPTSVAVTDNMGNVLAENNENDSMTTMTTSQLALRKEYEKYLATQVQNFLAPHVGPNQSQVRVSAEINFDSITQREEKLDSENIVPEQTTKTEENTESSLPTSGGAPGVTANTTETNTATGMGNNNTSKKTQNTVHNRIPTTTSTLTKIPGDIKRISAAVFVAARMEGEGASRKMVSRPKEELEKLRKLVQAALGIQEGNGRSDQLVLEEMLFKEQPAHDLALQVERDQRRQFWWELARNAIYPAMALAILGCFWQIFKKTPGQTIPLGIPLDEIDFSGNGHGNGNGNGNGHGLGLGRGKRGMPGTVTVEVLNQLIKENPDNMTQAIRNWMTRGKTK
jgi:flagellar M-ring protein FliF